MPRKKKDNPDNPEAPQKIEGPPRGASDDELVAWIGHKKAIYTSLNKADIALYKKVKNQLKNRSDYANKKVNR